MGSTDIAAVVLFAALANAVICGAQEVGFVDLTQVEARVDLRHPVSESRASSMSTIGQTKPCFGRVDDAGALRTTLVSLDRSHYQIGDEPVFEVTVENVGARPLKIPFSPHLADLQPKDPSQKFSYRRLDITLWVAAGEQWTGNTGGSVALYGSDGRPGTMLTLNPGEWVRIVGRGDLELPMDGMGPTRTIDHLFAQSALDKVEVLMTPTAAASVSREICLAQTHGQSLSIVLVTTTE